MEKSKYSGMSDEERQAAIVAQLELMTKLAAELNKLSKKAYKEKLHEDFPEYYKALKDDERFPALVKALKAGYLNRGKSPKDPRRSFHSRLSEYNFIKSITDDLLTPSEKK